MGSKNKRFQKAAKIFKKVPILNKTTREIARVLDQVVNIPVDAAVKTVNYLSGKDKIKKRAERYQEQCRQEVNDLKSKTLENMSLNYQQQLKDIQEIKLEIIKSKEDCIQEKEDIKSAMMDLSLEAPELLEQYNLIIQEIIAELTGIQQVEQDMLSNMENHLQKIKELEQQMEDNLIKIAEEIIKQYEELEQQNENNITELQEQEAALEDKYILECATIKRQYDNYLNNTLQQIEEWKARASRKAIKNLAIQLAGNVVAPGIMEIIAICKAKNLTHSLLKAAVSRVIGESVKTKLVAPLHIENMALNASLSGSLSGGITAAVTRGPIVAGAVMGGVQAYIAQSIKDRLTATEATDLSIVAESMLAETKVPTKSTVLTESKVSTESIVSASSTVPEKLEPVTISEISAIPEVTVELTAAKESRPVLFTPMKAVYDNAIYFTGNPSRKTADTKAKTLIAKDVGDHFRMEITPYLSSQSAISSSEPNIGTSIATMEHQGSFGIHVARFNSDLVKADLDLLRVDTQITGEVAVPAAPGLFGESFAEARFSTGLKGAVAVVTTEIGPVNVPLTNLQCTATARVDLGGFKVSGSNLALKAADVNVDLDCVPQTGPLLPRSPALKP